MTGVQTAGHAGLYALRDNYKRWLKPLFPFLKWLPEVRTTWRSDLFAGLTGAVLVLPQGVAFAMIAGLPPQYGLYSAMIPAIVAALYGSSRHLISGPTTAISIVIFGTLVGMAEPGSAHYIELAMILTFITGIFQFALGVSRLGGLINFVSHSVVTGFTSGAALLIAASQLKHVFGLIFKNKPEFVENLQQLAINIGQYNPRSLTVAAVTLTAVIVIHKLKPRWPGMLIAMVIGSVLTASLGWNGYGVRVVGALPASLPPFKIPNFSLESIKLLATPALAVAILGLMEAVSIARSIALHSGQRIDGNQEFIGQGLSNIVGALFSSYACSGSFTRSGINYQTGAKTAAAAVFAAVLLGGILLLIAPYVAYLPMPSMAAVILVVAYKLVNFHHIGDIFKVSRSDTSVMAVTFLSVLFLELEFAIYIGTLLSIWLYLKKTAKPAVLTKVPEPITRKFVTNQSLSACPQLGIVAIEGDMYFAATSYVEEQISHLRALHPEQNKLIVVASNINHIDSAGCESFKSIINEYRRNNGDIYFCGIKPKVYDILKVSGVIDIIGSDHIFDHKKNSLKNIVPLLDMKKCINCKCRIFTECDINKSIGLKIYSDDERTDYVGHCIPVYEAV
ncbi:MAG: SulP family inorganic anion transporter [Nitrospirae bacterium]|nr:SulP family inorganic anion transporter [Nitrospirota bacterium]MBF0533491.1 SulP family inorganic anion transporter [Nitrospirota bacterium]MBF0615985.1 SulP family inorganic anion transporter [Nitrospirota bacterium]